MIIEVFLIVCLNTANRLGCDRIQVTDNLTSQDNGAEVNMTGCLGTEGFFSAQKYFDAHREQLGNMQFGGWACKVGNKPLPPRGKA